VITAIAKGGVASPARPLLPGDRRTTAAVWRTAAKLKDKRHEAPRKPLEKQGKKPLQIVGLRQNCVNYPRLSSEQQRSEVQQIGILTELLSF
jgi:hypothetical protein